MTDITNVTNFPVLTLGVKCGKNHNCCKWANDVIWWWKLELHVITEVGYTLCILHFEAWMRCHSPVTYLARAYI